MHKTSFATLGAIGGCSAKAAHPAATVVAHSAAHPAAPAAAHAAAPTATCKYGSKCNGCNFCGKKKAPAKAAGGGDGGISAQLSAMQKKLDQIEVKIDSGFEAQEKRSLALQEQGSKSYADTMQMFKAFGSIMTGGFTAINTTHRELSAPSTRLAICASSGLNATEVVEQPRKYVHSCFASNEGGSASHSSQRPQSSAACGGNSAESQYHGQNGWSEGQRTVQSTQSYGSISHSPADQRFPTSGSGHSANVPQSLEEMMRIIPPNMKGFRGLCGHILADAAKPGAKPVPQFTFHKISCAWQMSCGNDDLACTLMSTTQGKPLAQQRLQPGIATALKKTDLSVFSEFFRRISAQYPSYVLTYNWKGPGGQERKTLYGTFASDQNLLKQFIHEHLLA